MIDPHSMSSNHLVGTLIEECAHLHNTLAHDYDNFAGQTVQAIHDSNQEKLAVVKRLESMAIRMRESINEISKDPVASAKMGELKALLSGCDVQIQSNTKVIQIHIDQIMKIFSRISGADNSVTLYDKKGSATP